MSQYGSVRKIQGHNFVNRYFSYRPIVLFVTIFFVIFGFRPLSPYLGDTSNYGKQYKVLQTFGVFDSYESDVIKSDYLFYYFRRFCALLSVDVHVWLASIMLFYLTMMFLGCKKIDYRHGAILMLFCLGSFVFYPYAVNGIRNGVACSFAIMAVACLCKEKKLSALMWSVIAIGCHKSAVLPVVAMFFVYYVNNPKYMYISWIGAIVLSLAIGGYIENILLAINYDERLVTQLQGDNADGQVLEHRFRWDFLLYSSLPIILGWYTIFKRKLYDKPFLILIGTYIYSNALWVLTIRAMFSNRIAYLSWFIYPVVLAYPLMNFPVFKKQHVKKTSLLLIAHLILTIVLLRGLFYWNLI